MNDDDDNDNDNIDDDDDNDDDKTDDYSEEWRIVVHRNQRAKSPLQTREINRWI